MIVLEFNTNFFKKLYNKYHGLFLQGVKAEFKCYIFKVV